MAALAAATIGVLWVALAIALHGQTGPGTRSVDRAVAREPGAAQWLPESGPKPQAHPIYRYSIVPGGVHTAAEVLRATANDPIVAAHYANVDPNRLRPERLAAPLAVHVSYRIGNKIYWTRNKLRLAVGEPVLTDGKVILRTRCGNMLSTYRRTPQFAGEPEVAEFDMATEVVAVVPDLASGSSPQVIAAHHPSWSSIRPARKYSQIPGPDTLTLLGLGLIAAWARHRYRRREQ